MASKFNNSVSVNCVIFGFDGRNLKVLLVKQNDTLNQENEKILKLPGSMILEEESINTTAYRVVSELVNLNDFFISQLHVFSKPDRFKEKDLHWVNKKYKIEATRVITVAYYALVNLSKDIEEFAESESAIWIDVKSIKSLGFDHNEMISEAMETLSSELINKPVAFELLPEKFTIRELQDLYMSILGIEIDDRNFRKKILSSDYLISTHEKEKDVAHKPATFYTFNRELFRKNQDNKFKLYF